MDRKNIYEILIEFDNSKNQKLFEGNIDYLGSKSYQDYVLITQDKIAISAKRSSKVDLQTIFYNHNSSLYNQIIKSLAYYYCISKSYFEIEKIKIIRKSSTKKLDEKTFKKSEINQIVSSEFKLSSKFEPTKLEIIFSETEKGKMLLNSISHYLSAHNSNDDYEKFERLWKSFNPLYRAIGKQNTEFDNLKETRNFILANHTCLKLSIPTVNKLDAKELRLKLRWRALILNNYPTESDTKNYKNSILRYTDYRIMNAYLETIGNREQFLKNKNWHTQVINHLNHHINLKTKVDFEVISVLTLRYMYFVRNKSFHGEKIDSTFRLTINKEINEFGWLNKRLEPFIVDLINANDKY